LPLTEVVLSALPIAIACGAIAADAPTTDAPTAAVAIAFLTTLVPFWWMPHTWMPYEEPPDQLAPLSIGFCPSPFRSYENDTNGVFNSLYRLGLYGDQMPPVGGFREAVFGIPRGCW
jgi:hypothetical protein